jgi:hypothetical protein
MLNYSGSLWPLENTSYFLDQAFSVVSFFVQRQMDAIWTNLKFKDELAANESAIRREFDAELELSTHNMLARLQPIGTVQSATMPMSNAVFMPLLLQCSRANL